MLLADECLDFAMACLEFARNPKTSPEHRPIFIEMASKWMQIADELNGTATPPKSVRGPRAPILQ